MPLTERAKEVPAFITPDGFFHYKVMPFGMRNTPATFQRLTYHVIHGVKGCEAYTDDVIVYSDSWKEHIEQIGTFFKRVQEANLTINLTKSEFGHAQVSFLGHVVGHH